VNGSACSVAECGRAVLCRGYCVGHYSKFGGGGKCKVSVCDRPAGGGCAGYCQAHYARSLAGKPVDVPLADRSPTTPAKFWALVKKGDGCWLWQGAISELGYGYRGGGRNFIQAHCYSWEQANGPIPPGMFVCHDCDNPPCVRPDHLFLGTSADNNRDRHAKGRTVVPRLKLNANDAIDIRTLAGLSSVEDLSAAYDMTIPSIVRVLNRETWRNVP
jgi:hypothetical protein